MPEPRGVLDTCTFIDLKHLTVDRLPEIPELTAITLTELHQGVAMAATAGRRALRLEVLNAAIDEFDPLPYDAEAAGRFGTLAALTVERGRSPKPRRMDLMIAAVASVHEVPLYTRNAADFKGLESVLQVIEV